jgi:hypothetical protein
MEETEAGEPHLHFVARFPFQPTSTFLGTFEHWLSDQMLELGAAPVVNVQAMRGLADAKQVARYIAKQPCKFTGCKRFWTSFRWLKTTLDEVAAGVWSVVRLSLSTIARSLRAGGIPFVWRSPHRIEWPPGSVSPPSGFS